MADRDDHQQLHALSEQLTAEDSQRVSGNAGGPTKIFGEIGPVCARLIFFVTATIL